MLKEIKSFASSLANSSMDKEVGMVDMTIDTFRNFGVETIPLLIEQLGEDDNIAVTGILADLGLGRKNSNKEKLENLLSFSKTVVDNERTFKDNLSTINNYLTDKTITVREAALLDMLEDLNTMSNYLVDLMLVLSFALGDQDYFETKKAKKFFGLKKDFNMLFTIYNHAFDKRLTAINKASSTKVDELDKSHLNKDDSNLEIVMSSFRGNPIYHVRKAWVDVEIWRVRVLQDKKALLGAKLIELKTLKEQGSTKDLSKQIEYYKQQIEKTEYKIHKLQEV